MASVHHRGEHPRGHNSSGGQTGSQRVLRGGSEHGVAAGPAGGPAVPAGSPADSGEATRHHRGFVGPGALQNPTHYNVSNPSRYTEMIPRTARDSQPGNAERDRHQPKSPKQRGYHGDSDRAVFSGRSSEGVSLSHAAQYEHSIVHSARNPGDYQEHNARQVHTNAYTNSQKETPSRHRASMPSTRKCDGPLYDAKTLHLLNAHQSLNKSGREVDIPTIATDGHRGHGVSTLTFQQTHSHQSPILLRKNIHQPHEPSPSFTRKHYSDLEHLTNQSRDSSSSPTLSRRTNIFEQQAHQRQYEHSRVAHQTHLSSVSPRSSAVSRPLSGGYDNKNSDQRSGSYLNTPNQSRVRSSSFGHGNLGKGHGQVTSPGSTKKSVKVTDLDEALLEMDCKVETMPRDNFPGPVPGTQLGTFDYKVSVSRNQECPVANVGLQSDIWNRKDLPDFSNGSKQTSQMREWVEDCSPNKFSVNQSIPTSPAVTSSEKMSTNQTRLISDKKRAETGNYGDMSTSVSPAHNFGSIVGDLVSNNISASNVEVSATAGGADMSELQTEVTDKEYDPRMVRQKVASIYNSWKTEKEVSSPGYRAENNIVDVNRFNASEIATKTDNFKVSDSNVNARTTQLENSASDAVLNDGVALAGTDVDRMEMRSSGVKNGVDEVVQSGNRSRLEVIVDKVVVWPQTVPDKLNFHHLDIFEGQMLLQWLMGVYTEEHYLYYLLTRQDLKVLSTQFCTHLLAAGVMKPLEEGDKSADTVFKPLSMYYWTHTETQYQANQPHTSLPEKLIPVWPPPEWEEGKEKPGLKYTEADVQAIVMTKKKEFAREILDLKKDHQISVESLQQESVDLKAACDQRLLELEKEIQKYKDLIHEVEKQQEEERKRIEILLRNQSRSISDNRNTETLGEKDLPNGDIRLNGFDDGVSHGGVPLPPPVPAPPPGIPIPPPLGSAFPTSSSVPPPPPGPPRAPPPPMMMGVKKGPGKPQVQTRSPMKPLYWKRIQIDPVKQNSEVEPVWEKIKEPSVDIDEFEELFSKVITQKKKIVAEKVQLASKKQVAKLLDPKRSQNLGILISSKHLDIQEVESAILNFDTSVITAEDLQAIYDHRPTKDELSLISKYVRSDSELPLDRPEQFLYDLCQITSMECRLKCQLFQTAFVETVSTIEHKLNNLKLTSQMLLSGAGVYNVLSLLLAFGNYMNGGNRTRGQADGFNLDILSKLKDVKSKDNSSSLLHYLVSQFIQRFDTDAAGTDKARLPLPEPSDVIKAAEINFDDSKKELRLLNKELTECKKDIERVLSDGDDSNRQPFASIMESFLETGKRFDRVILFYCVQPKVGKEEVTPRDFFSSWISFCSDFKDIWKREQHRIIKGRMDEEARKARGIQAEKRASVSVKAKTLGSLVVRVDRKTDKLPKSKKTQT